MIRIRFSLLSLLLASFLLSCISITIERQMPQKAAQVTVSNVTELQAALKEASIGDTLLLQGEDFAQACTLRVKSKGPTPIILMSASDRPATITAPWRIEGKGLIFHGITFTGKARLELAGEDLRIEACRFDGITTPQWLLIRPDSRACVVTGCTFTNKRNNPELAVYSQLMVITVNNKQEAHRIVGNHFESISKGKTGNGYECIQLITKGNPFDPGPGDAAVLIAGNTFKECNGEAEVISVKANGNTIKGNSFIACRGSLVLRHGHRNRVLANYFDGQSLPATGGIRLQGQEQLISDNRFQDLSLPAIVLMQGTADSLYMPVKDVTISGNQIFNCASGLEVDLLHGDYKTGIAASEVAVKENLIYSQNQHLLLHRGDSTKDWIWQGNVSNQPIKDKIARIEGLELQKADGIYRIAVEVEEAIPATGAQKAGAPAKPYIEESDNTDKTKQAK